ncbi:DUF6528 family protein [Streptomyces sp. SID3343]|uniref:DUF6528 family protein n=1 Tax=Streptomyces sp. SID3343 TaxID=2690260 RepID=UPI00137014C4|nr:hypothetical protein [Streptomyces sp. SID3343]
MSTSLRIGTVLLLVGLWGSVLPAAEAGATQPAAPARESAGESAEAARWVEATESTRATRPTRSAESRIVVADQGSRSVVVLAAPAGAGSRRSEANWSWSADRDPGLGDLRPAHTWTNPSEAKRRQLHDHDYLLAGASGGLAAVVAYPSARVYWAADVGSDNLHSLELLPDGNVAVTASTGGYLRVYAASQGPRARRYVQASLPGAHGVHYDPAGALLWALGDRELVAYSVTGTAAAPTLTRVRTATLPETGGHDLSPVLSAPGRLWITGHDHVWQYDPAARTFEAVHLSADPRDEAGVKSIGDDPATGRILTVRPTADNPCSWCTSTLTLFRPDGTRTLANARLYKARWWTARRQ